MLDCWLWAFLLFAAAAATTLQLNGTRDEPHQQSLAAHKTRSWAFGDVEEKYLSSFLVLYTAQKSSLLNTLPCVTSAVFWGGCPKPKKSFLYLAFLPYRKGVPFFSYYPAASWGGRGLIRSLANVLPCIVRRVRRRLASVLKNCATTPTRRRRRYPADL